MHDAEARLKRTWHDFVITMEQRGRTHYVLWRPKGSDCQPMRFVTGKSPERAEAKADAAISSYVFSTDDNGDTSDAPMADKIAETCDAIKAMLVEKNKAYGNSATEPVRIFSSASSDEQLLVRIDDKLSRIARGKAMGEDVIDDLIGYLVLLKIVRGK